MIKLTKNFKDDLVSILSMCERSLPKEKYKKLLHLNGLADEQLDYTEFIDNFVGSNVVADASIDGNANVRTKDIVTLLNEMSKPHSKLLALNKIHHELTEKYGVVTAKEWLAGEICGATYLHDAYSSTFVPYCYAYSLKEVAEKGLFFIEDFGAKPPKHLDTFIDFVAEFISYNCNRTSGAVGLPDFLVYAYYFYKLDEDYVAEPKRYLRQQFQRFIYRCNQPFLRAGTQSAFVNTSIFDTEFFFGLFGGQTYPDGTPIMLTWSGFMEFQKEFMNVMSEIRSENMFTFPVNTISLCKRDGKFVDESFAKWASWHNMKWGDSNFYISDSVDTLSNCCRLQSNVRDLYFNSIGGTALSVGSVKVNTINLASIAFEAEHDKEDYLLMLEATVHNCLMTLDVVRDIIKKNIKKGLLPNYTHGLISLDTQYNTIGINGLYEALCALGLIEKDNVGFVRYSNEAIEFAEKIMEVIHHGINKFKEEYNIDYMINIEQVPGENCARILKEKDEIFNHIKTELPLYGNQWIPLGVKATLTERVRVCSILDKACNGGSILHINLDKPFSDEETAWEMLNYVSDEGVNYFAFNTRISACEDNHGFYGDVCPVCGKPKVTEYTRIVGFLTPIKSWSNTRKEEFRLRQWHENN